MYKELIEKCEELGIDINKAYTAMIVDMSIGRDNELFEDVCDRTYKEFNETSEEIIA